MNFEKACEVLDICAENCQAELECMSVCHDTMLRAGKSPAISDRFIAVSERIPETDGIAGDDGGKAKDRVRLSLSQAICKHSF
ncbi:TPA: hypothetical protein ACWZ80_002513 [Klebsiella pneumoniae]|uniref:hypothetical protein n=1 Tax=Klebsiella pneumoniae TaxID=573 RepID=UPI00273106DA|nr:hypothetical protein [Klebsiella pneumoniae]MDP0887395.1 hypothetical protein [Klebsiella pneumoniae]